MTSQFTFYAMRDALSYLSEKPSNVYLTIENAANAIKDLIEEKE